MADKNKINQIKLPNGQQYEIDAKYWGGKTLSDIKPSDFGLSAVLKYCGITTTELVDGSTATTVVIDGQNHTAEPGCVVFRDIIENEKTVTQEFVYNGSKWELIGKDLTYKVVQDTVLSPDVDGDATAFIDTISQDANGVITATKKNVKIPKPDWNAQEGEAGYIENRPFYDNINNKFDINDFEERIETEEEFGETYTYSVYTKTIYNWERYNLAIKFKDYGGGYEYYFIKYKEEKDILTPYGGITIKPSSDNEYIIIEIEATNFQNCLDNVYYTLYEDYYNDYIKHIPDAFIPDTVLKTTPQTLSNTVKNQALANLGLTDIVYNSQLTEEVSNINKTIEDNEEVVAEALNKLNDELKNIYVNTSQLLVNITYSELVNLRDNGELIPGQQYRITDYTTTTVQEYTQSAGHQFDIIVTADGVNVLNEKARAIQHTISEYDYFYHSNLNAWELWYSLDNDTSRFYWADVDNGKGVIYRMIDEWKNDIPYDFKNIQFKRWKVDTNVEGADTSGFDKYIGFKSGVISIHDVMQDLFIVDDNDYVWSYTLQIYSSDGLIGDASNCIGTSNYVECKYNTILSYSIDEIRYLNNVVIFGSYTSGNQCVKGNLFETDCHSMTIGSDNSEVWENKFGQFCKGNVICADAICQNKFGQNMTSVAIIPASSTSHVASNTFNGNYFQYNFINGVFYYNTIGDAFKNNTILSAFQQNNIGDMFQENILSKKFVLNNIGVQCKDNKFNDEFKGNTVDNGMNGNIFNGKCTYTSFGKVFEKNVLNDRLNSCEIGYGAVDNTFGDVINSRFGALFQNNEIVKCKACDFGVGFRFNKFTDVFEGKNIGVSCSRFGDYVWYNNFNTDVVFNDDNTSVIQNLNVQSNLQGTESSYLNIVVPVDSNAEIKVAKNTNGEVKVYCEADLIA